jgi:predicted transcriptional regulator
MKLQICIYSSVLTLGLIISYMSIIIVDLPYNTLNIFKALSDEKTSCIFQNIAILQQKDKSGVDGNSLKAETKLSHKQYYLRTFRLTKAGLIKRNYNKYSLTLLGELIYDMQKMVEDSVKICWKVEAIDSVEALQKIPKEHVLQIIHTLIQNPYFKEILKNNVLSE